MKISDKFFVSKIADENIILPIDNDCVNYNSCYILNDTAMFIVQSLPLSYEELLDKMVENYDVDVAKAKNELDKFLNEVNKYGIIE